MKTTFKSKRNHTTGKREDVPHYVAEKGDAVNCKGITAVINTIEYQDYYEEGEKYWWDIEFIDTHGNYRHWKQFFDGGNFVGK